MVSSVGNNVTCRALFLAWLPMLGLQLFCMGTFLLTPSMASADLDGNSFKCPPDGYDLDLPTRFYIGSWAGVTEIRTFMLTAQHSEEYVTGDEIAFTMAVDQYPNTKYLGDMCVAESVGWGVEMIATLQYEIQIESCEDISPPLIVGTAQALSPTLYGMAPKHCDCYRWDSCLNDWEWESDYTIYKAAAWSRGVEVKIEKAESFVFYWDHVNNRSYIGNCSSVNSRYDPVKVNNARRDSYEQMNFFTEMNLFSGASNCHCEWQSKQILTKSQTETMWTPLTTDKQEKWGTRQYLVGPDHLGLDQHVFLPNGCTVNPNLNQSSCDS